MSNNIQPAHFSEEQPERFYCRHCGEPMYQIEGYMKYAKMIMRNKESNKYDHVNSTEVGIKVPQCLFASAKIKEARDE